MTELSFEMKSQLISDIEKGDEAALRGIMETLKICLCDEDKDEDEDEEKENPNTLEIEFTLTQLDFLSTWSGNSGFSEDSIVRGLVDTMIRYKPELGQPMTEEEKMKLRGGKIT